MAIQSFVDYLDGKLELKDPSTKDPIPSDNRVITTDSDNTIVVAPVSVDELNTLQGITDNIQTQLDSKATVGDHG